MILFFGSVGLNDLKQSDWFNAAAQLLLRITPLRNFFLNPANYEHAASPLVQTWGEFTRKVSRTPRSHTLLSHLFLAHTHLNSLPHAAISP
jgi:hypothetical protein